MDPLHIMHGVIRYNVDNFGVLTSAGGGGKWMMGGFSAEQTIGPPYFTCGIAGAPYPELGLSARAIPRTNKPVRADRDIYNKDLCNVL